MKFLFFLFLIYLSNESFSQSFKSFKRFGYVGLKNHLNQVIVPHGKYLEFVNIPTQGLEYSKDFIKAIDFVNVDVINKNGEVINKKKIQEVRQFSDNKFIVKHNGLFYLMDTLGNISALGFDNIEIIINGATVVSKNGKSGLLGTNNELLIPCKFPKLFRNAKNRNIAYPNSSTTLCSVIDDQGKWIIEPKENISIAHRKPNDWFFTSDNGIDKRYINENGKDIFEDFKNTKIDFIDSFLIMHYRDYSAVKSRTSHNFTTSPLITIYHLNETIHYGQDPNKGFWLIDNKGNITIHNMRMLGMPIIKQKILCEDLDNGNVYIYTKGSLHKTVYDKVTVLPKNYQYKEFYKVKNGDKYGVLDDTLGIIIPCEAEQIRTISENYDIITYNVLSKTNTYFLRENKSANANVSYYYGGNYYVSISNVDQKHSLLSLNNDQILEKSYDWIKVSKDGEYAILYTNRFKNKISKTNEKPEKTTPLLEMIKLDNPTKKYLLEYPLADELFKYGYASAGYLGKYALIDTNGKAITERIYDRLSDDYYGNWVTRKDEKYGITNKNINLNIPPKYDIDPFRLEGTMTKYTIAIGYGKHKWGLIDIITNETIPPIDDDIVPQDFNGNKVYTCTIGSKQTYFNQSLQKIERPNF